MNDADPWCNRHDGGDPNAECICSPTRVYVETDG